MSNAKSTTNQGAPPSAPEAPSTPSQTAVLLVQVDALGSDDVIRSEIKKKGFVVAQQALVYLTEEDARHFVLHVSNPDSAMYKASKTDDNGTPEHPASTTPREKVATPRSPRVLESNATAITNPDDAVLGLSRGPVLMLALQKPNAIADLQELVGPATSELWRVVPQCLRARFGQDPCRIGVRCSAHAATVANEVAFLLEHTHAPSASGHHQCRRPHSQSAAVDLDQLLDFCFPPHVQHPNSTGRLFVFGLYGPLDDRTQLRAGEKGLHVVTDRELDTMSSRMEREDILSVYGMCSLSHEHEEEVLKTVDGVLKAFARYSKRDVEALFRKLQRDGDGRLSFHDMQAAIMKERCRRVLCMKERVHPTLATPIQNKFRQTMTRIMKTRDEVAPATMFLKDLGFTGAENATLVSRLLSSHSFEICHLDDGNSPELTQNVRLLRERTLQPHDAHPPWNPNCQGSFDSNALRK